MPIFFLNKILSERIANILNQIFTHRFPSPFFRRYALDISRQVIFWEIFGQFMHKHIFECLKNTYALVRWQQNNDLSRRLCVVPPFFVEGALSADRMERFKRLKSRRKDSFSFPFPTLHALS